VSLTSEATDTLAQLLGSHRVLVEREAELGLVVDVALLRDVEGLRRLGVQLLRDGDLRVVEFLEEGGGDGEIVATGQLDDLTDVAERSTHHDGLVAVLLVVVEDVLDGLDTGVFVGREVLASGGLVPVEDTADERRNQEGTGLSGSNSLHLGEHKSQVAVDAVLVLQLARSLDTLPGGGKLDQHARLVDADALVQVDDVQGLVNGSLLVERQRGIDLGGNLAGDDLEDLLAELDQQHVHGSLNLAVDVTTVLLTELDGGIDELGVLGLLGSSEDQRGVRRGL
jgi:hypothetical protein